MGNSRNIWRNNMTGKNMISSSPFKKAAAEILKPAAKAVVLQTVIVCIGSGFGILAAAVEHLPPSVYPVVAFAGGAIWGTLLAPDIVRFAMNTKAQVTGQNPSI
jgi:hypothetical protein